MNMPNRFSGIRPRLLVMMVACAFASLGVVLFATHEDSPQDRQGALFGAALVGGLAVVAVWRGVELMVIRRIRALLGATSQLRGGDSSARTGGDYGTTEMGALEREFDGMAAALQQQQADRLRAEGRLRLSEARKSAVLEASFDGILLLNGLGSVMECNAAARAMFGCDGRRCVHHRLTDLLPQAQPFDSSRFGRPAELLETAARRLDGTQFPVEMSIAPIRDPGAHGLYVATVRDITPRKQLERSLEALSFEDELTGTHNRRGFLMFASQQLKVALRNRQSLVLVSVDLDGLKRINDHFGHANGDRALVELAQALRASFRETDVIGRLGGDEFVVLAAESEQRGAELALERFVMRIASRNAAGDLPWTLSASIGWVRVDPSQGATLGDMLARVDARMYEHKRRAGLRAVPLGPSLEPDERTERPAPDPAPRAAKSAAGVEAEPQRAA